MLVDGDVHVPTTLGQLSSVTNWVSFAPETCKETEKCNFYSFTLTFEVSQHEGWSSEDVYSDSLLYWVQLRSRPVRVPRVRHRRKGNPRGLLLRRNVRLRSR